MRQWPVQKDYRWVWPIALSVVGLAMMSGGMMLMGRH